LRHAERERIADAGLFRPAFNRPQEGGDVPQGVALYL